MNVTLQLRFSPGPLREAAAWFIPGADPRGWLAEMTSWAVPLAAAKLYVVPGGADDYRLSLRERTPFRGAKGDTPAGVVVMLASSTKPSRTAVALPYGKLARNLLLPVEAELDPPLGEAELAGLLPGTSDALVWHPAGGLVRFDAAAALSVVHLLAPPQASGRKWDAAVPGIATNQRLLSIEPLDPPSFEQVMQAGRDGIGSQPMNSGGLGKAPGEPVGGAIGRAVAGAGLAAAAGAAGMLAGAAQAVSAGLSGLLGGMTGGQAASSPAQQSRQKPAASGGPNWMERLANWAKQRRQAMQQNLEQLRHNQIERLLHALQNSPDLGLRFALPLTATGAGRGLATPGANLTERNVNFNLGGLGGGGPVDFWDISEGYRRQLAQRYRELANREIALGRHRRAAYILAELLGDLHSAAATLADGGHFREAAVLYEQRLNQPLAAARCLQRGGLLTEAVALFERLGEWETAGDLYTQLDQPEPAERAYHQAVARLHAAKDVLGAARLLETKLHLPDRAFMTLLGGWDNPNQAERCLDEMFALLARGNNHERAEWVIPQTIELGPRRPSLLAGILARVSANYPHEGVREIARTTTRELVSRNLPESNTADSESLLRALRMLVPSDRLLERDCRRYQDQRAEEERRRLARLQTRPQRAPGNRPRLVTSFRLPQGQWKAAVAAGDEFYAAGFYENWLMVVRGRWDGHVQMPTGDPCVVPAAATEGPIFLAADPRGLSWTYLHVPPQHPQREVQFAATDKYPRAMRVSPVWGSDKPLEGLTYGLGNALHLLTLPEPGIAQVVPYDQAQRLQGIRTIEYSALNLDHPFEEELDLVRPLPFFAREQSLYMAIGPWLISQSARTAGTLLDSTILSITGSAQHTRARIVVGCEQGGYVLWGEAANSPTTRFSQDLHQPVVGLSRGGWLVAATKASIEVFSTHDGRLGFHGQISDFGQEPLSVLPAADANRFAVIATNGLVSIYEVPE